MRNTRSFEEQGYITTYQLGNLAFQERNAIKHVIQRDKKRLESSEKSVIEHCLQASYECDRFYNAKIFKIPFESALRYLGRRVEGLVKDRDILFQLLEQEGVEDVKGKFAKAKASLNANKRKKVRQDDTRQGK